MAGTPTRVAWLERAVTQLTDALRTVDEDATVPNCPGWTVADLVEHIVQVHRWAAAILLTASEQTDPPVRRPAGALADWYRRSADVLLHAVQVREPDEECWNFAPVPQVAGFWPRRQAHEVTIHGVDAIQAGGGSPLIAPDLAADGVDELFTVFFPRLHVRRLPVTLTASLCVRADDTGHAWTLHPRADGPPDVVREERDAAAKLTGGAAELYLALWKRGSADGLRVDGDAAVPRALFAGRTAP